MTCHFTSIESPSMAEKSEWYFSGSSRIVPSLGSGMRCSPLAKT